MELGATQYTVDPHTQVAIPFSIKVPDNATPGDHVGAIVAQKVTDPTQPDSGVGLDVRVRIGARIYVRVKGQVSQSLAIERFDVQYDTPSNPLGDSAATVVYTVTNTGDVRLTPKAHLTVSGLFGSGERSVPDRDIPELLPGGSIQISELVQHVPPRIRLTAELELTADADQGQVLVSGSVTWWAIPWVGVAIVLALLVLVLLVIVRRRRLNA